MMILRILKVRLTQVHTNFRCLKGQNFKNIMLIMTSFFYFLYQFLVVEYRLDGRKGAFFLVQGPREEVQGPQKEVQGPDDF